MATQNERNLNTVRGSATANYKNSKENVKFIPWQGCCLTLSLTPLITKRAFSKRNETTLLNALFYLQRTIADFQSKEETSESYQQNQPKSLRLRFLTL